MNPVTEGFTGAREVRRSLGVGDLQPLDLLRSAEALGVLVVHRPFAIRTVSGMRSWIAELDQSLVVVNSSDSKLRQRFTLAHELAHHYFRDEDTLVENLESISTPSSASEKRANAFAAELLLPERAIKAWAPGQPWGDDIDDVAHLASHYLVSMDAALWRLKSSGRISDEQRQELYSSRSAISPDLQKLLSERGDETVLLSRSLKRILEGAVDAKILSSKKLRALLATREQF
jgi:Zn-dependent peptidase ImmA (M78 family)